MLETLIVQPIFNLLVAIYSIVPGSDFGISIILFTVLVRLVLWPLLRSQLHQSRAMRKLQPELAKINKQHKDNPQARGYAMMELYKRHNVKPFRSILMALIQLPIWIGIYQVVRILTDHAAHPEKLGQLAYPFVQQLGEVQRVIAHPEAFNKTLFGVIDLTRHALDFAHFDGVTVILFVIALIGAYLQWLIARQTMPHTGKPKTFRQIMQEAAEGKQADQSELNALVSRKMTGILPFMMFFIMISVPGALALYMVVSNVVVYFMQRLILREDQEELQEIASEQKETLAMRAKKAEKAEIVATVQAKKSGKGKKQTKQTSETNITRVVAKTGKRKRS